jgi:hypothetical protein
VITTIEEKVMGNYRCAKCGEAASSKCANQRNVFPSDLYATVLGNSLKIDAYRLGAKKESYRRADTSDLWEVTYTFTVGVRAQDEAEAKAKQELSNFLIDIPKESLKKALCEHDWELTAETCEFGCCKRKAEEVHE